MPNIKTSITFSYKDLCRIYADIKEVLLKTPERIPDITVAEVAEQYRVMPVGTPFPGKWRNKRTPYLVEIMEALSANHPAREIAFAKSAQVGATSVIENWIGYVIKSVPGPMLYISGNDKLLEKWTAKRLQPLLMSMNLKMYAQFKEKGQRRTGDKMFSKEFPGGSLDLVTANSAVGLRMDSARYLGMDETDSYKWDVGGEGDPKAVAKARTKAWGKRKKILYSSTPTTYDESHIWPLYEYGDQRRYHIPCKHCGEFQFIEFDGIDNKGGMKFDRSPDGTLIVDSVRYECIKCGKPHYEVDKYNMMQAGEWRPTATTSDPNFRSYHISALYSLMEDWEEIVRNRIKGEEDKEKMQAHVNLDLGMPYRETGERPDIKRVYELRGNYKAGNVPDGVLFLTGAIDVQRGSKHGKENVARLEIEICGHGYAYKTWSILYKVIKGNVMDPFGGAWEKLHKWVEEGGFRFYRSDGFEFAPSIVGIDSSDGNVENVVFDFCEGWGNTFPIKGQQTLKKSSNRADGNLDEQSPKDADRFREHKKDGRIYYVIHTNWYKKKHYRNLKVKRQESGEQRPSFCEFPSDYPDKYFEMLTAEEWRPDTQSFWKPASKRNESLDLRVYNLCLQDIWLAYLL
jgi:phage terminase large subunit GpA-like protein